MKGEERRKREAKRTERRKIRGGNEKRKKGERNQRKQIPRQKETQISYFLFYFLSFFGH